MCYCSYMLYIGTSPFCPVSRLSFLHLAIAHHWLHLDQCALINDTKQVKKKYDSKGSGLLIRPAGPLHKGSRLLSKKWETGSLFFCHWCLLIGEFIESLNVPLSCPGFVAWVLNRILQIDPSPWCLLFVGEWTTITLVLIPSCPDNLRFVKDMVSLPVALLDSKNPWLNTSQWGD